MIITVVGFLFIFTATTTTTSNIFAQSGGAQEESEGDLTVVINGETFTTGQTITISGSVDEPGTSPPQIQIFDPVGTVVATAFPNLSADNTFTFSLVAGENDDPMLLAEGPMDRGGNYRVSVTFFPSFTNMDQVDMEFEYIVTPEPSPQPQTTTIPDTTTSPTTIARILNVTALRDMVIQGQQQAQELNNALIRANASDTILSELNAIQNTFQNIRGNLTGVSPQTQVIE